MDKKKKKEKTKVIIFLGQACKFSIYLSVLRFSICIYTFIFVIYLKPSGESI